MSSDARPDDRMRAFRLECLDHVDALYGAARRMMGNRQDAEDLVQETYLKAVRSFGRYREVASCRAWLFRILTNTYIDRYRRAKRSPRTVDYNEESVYHGTIARDEDPDFEVGFYDDPDELDAFLTRFVSDDVKRAVDALVEPFRLTVVLRDLLGEVRAESLETGC